MLNANTNKGMNCLSTALSKESGFWLSNDQETAERRRSTVISLLGSEVLVANLNVLNNGYTALHKAAFLKDVVVFQILVENGADPMILNKYKETATQLIEGHVNA